MRGSTVDTQNATVTVTLAELAADHGATAGRWTVARNGGTWDAMTGYGAPWALATARWISDGIDWVTECTITVHPADGGPAVTARYK
ncbi:hypothetical protein [Streptacidiphilus cavernicola]|uniref:Uncharacterized protein n=1 Tax=Streptacidiphilus cavernicola TaxID=3342716 RepID=A0ABV6VY54_9ACTN